MSGLKLTRGHKSGPSISGYCHIFISCYSKCFTKYKRQLPPPPQKKAVLIKSQIPVLFNKFFIAIHEDSVHNCISVLLLIALPASFEGKTKPNFWSRLSANLKHQYKDSSFLQQEKVLKTQHEIFIYLCTFQRLLSSRSSLTVLSFLKQSLHFLLRGGLFLLHQVSMAFGDTPAIGF